MKYLIVDPKTPAIAHNIALMKWARWCEDNGLEYQYVRGLVKPTIEPNRILISCIFTFYSKIYEKTIDYYMKMFPGAKVVVGGVFPSLHPKWFEKRKWGYKNIIMEPKVKVSRGMSQDIEHLVPKYGVDVLDEDDIKDFKEEEKFPNDEKKRKNRIVRQTKRNRKRQKIVLYASRGCPNKCGYCAVPRLEGKMKSFKSIMPTLEAGMNELKEPASVVLYDNNFTCHEYFDDIIDELIDFGLPIDIHGLHVSAFDEHIAKQFARLEWASQGQKGSARYLRFSFDKMEYKDNVRRALQIFHDANIKAAFFAYALFNFTDSPHDFWTRMVMSQQFTEEFNEAIYLFPQRYEPFSALEKYKYVGPKWTPELAAGVRRISTWLHGFLTVTPNRNLFKWIGHTEEEFFDKVMKFGTVRGYRLEKNEDDVPDLTY